MARRIEVPLQPADAHGAKQRRLIDLLRSRTMRRVFIVSGLLSMVWDLFSFVVPIHGHNINLSASTIGLILGAFGGAVFVVRLAMPLVIHRIGEWQMLIGAMIATGIALFIFPLVTTVPVLIALAFFLGAGLGGAQPMIMSLLYNKAPPGRGAEAIAVRTLLINISQTAIPLAVRRARRRARHDARILDHGGTAGRRRLFRAQSGRPRALNLRAYK